VFALSHLGLIEKNKLSSDFPWILLVEVVLSETETVRICKNTEDIDFGGHTWVCYDVDIGEIEEDNENSVTSVDLEIANINGMLDAQIDTYSGFTNAEIKLHSLLVTNDIPSLETTLSFNVSGSRLSGDYLILTLTSFNPFEVKLPRATLRKLICKHRDFKGSRCKYSGTATECDRTLKRCKQLGNEKNFGGAPSMGWSGVFL
jgi:phage-related protein